MVKVSKLTQDNISGLMEKILLKFKSFNNENAAIFDLDLIEEKITSNLGNFFERHYGYGIFYNKEIESFLLGYSNIPQLKGNEMGVYIPLWGSFFSTSNAFSLLYSEFSKQHIIDRVYTQIITYLPSNEQMEKELFNMGFGLLVIDAIRNLDLVDVKPLTSKFTLRPINSSDQKAIAQLDSQFCSYLSKSPTFLYSGSSNTNIDQFIGDNKITFIIEYNNSIIAAIRAIHMESNLQVLSGKQTISINFAFTSPKFRGHGIGSHLLNEVLNWGSKKGATKCTVDFESANLLAKKFWLKHFKPIAFSAIRRIDNRL